jgi:hypothetical protein
VTRWLVVALFGLLVVSGCGSSDEPSGSGPDTAYKNIEKAIVKGDVDACDKLTGVYKNKLAASTQLCESDCPAVVKAVGKRLRDDPSFQTKSIDQIKIKGDKATIVTHSTYKGRDVRTQVSMRRSAGGEWIISGDRELDEIAPAGPLAAYHRYMKEFRVGHGTEACALATKRGQRLMANTVPQSHGGGSCAGAVPFLAAATEGSPPAEVIGGTEKGDTATIYTLQSNNNGSWVSRDALMQRVDGKWLFDYAQDLGTAPAKRTQGGAVT